MRAQLPIPTLASLATLAAIMSAAPLAAQAGADAGRFRHEIHADYACTECHSTGRPTTSANRSWCAGCHHQNVGYNQCQQCHATEEISPDPVRALVTFHLSVGPSVTRSLTFDHDRHSPLGCETCHADGSGVRAGVDCTECHVDHHQRGRDCTSCHAEPRVTAHPETVHLDLAGCGQAGCHASEGIDFAALPDDRNLCVACHVGQREHESPQPCARCHILSDDVGGGRR